MSRLRVLLLLAVVAVAALTSASAQAHQTPPVKPSSKLAVHQRYRPVLHTPKAVYKALQRSLRATAPVRPKQPLPTRAPLMRVNTAATITTTTGTGAVNPTLQAADWLLPNSPVNGLNYHSDRPGALASNKFAGGYVFIDHGIFPNAFASQVLWQRADGKLFRVAGSNCQDYNGDGILATDACLSAAHGVSVLPDGSLLIADTFNNRVRYVHAADGKIWTIAGTGANCPVEALQYCISQKAPGQAPIPLTTARMDRPVSVKPAYDGNGFYVVTQGSQGDDTHPATHQNSVQWVVALNNTFVSITLAGNGSMGNSGDGGPSTKASFNNPADIAPMPNGAFFVADGDNCRIRFVAPGLDSSGKVVATVNAFAGSSCGSAAAPEGTAPLGIQMKQPGYIDVDKNYNLFVPDQYNNRIWEIIRDPYTGKYKSTSILVGRSTPPGWWAGDGLASNASLALPDAVLVTDSGLLITDTANNRIRLLSGY